MCAPQEHSADGSQQSSSIHKSTYRYLQTNQSLSRCLPTNQPINRYPHTNRSIYPWLWLGTANCVSFVFLSSSEGPTILGKCCRREGTKRNESQCLGTQQSSVFLYIICYFFRLKTQVTCKYCMLHGPLVAYCHFSSFFQTT